MKRKITVKGIGHITAKPDYVVIYMTIDVINKKLEKAIKEATGKIKMFSDILIDAGFEKDALKTVDYRVNINTEFRTNRKGISEPVRNGFICINRMKLAFDFDIEMLSKAIDAITTCISNPKLNITFTVKDEEAVKDKLLKTAGENAKRRAEILCESAGGKLGNLITVNYAWNEMSILSPTRFDAMQDTTILGNEDSAMPLMAPKTIAPDDIDLSDNAMFVWEII